jgi:hypothetical protein
MLAAQADVRRELVHVLEGDLDLQRRMCDPAFNPDAAAFFIFNFCLTQDEDREGGIYRLPEAILPADIPSTLWHEPGDASFALKWVEALDAPRTVPVNVHDEKSRRMLHTWIMCHYNLWAIQWVKGYSALLLSKSQDHVDDGGKSTMVFSLFSRIRFAYERLPDHVRRQVDFRYMSAICPENDAWLLGRAPTKDAGRAGGFRRAFVDECAFLEWMESIHIALDPACKFGKVYMSTVNGPFNVYARLAKQKPKGWVFFQCDWKEDPTKTVGLRETLPGPERERYGTHVSEWFITATSSLDDWEIAQEYGRAYHKSTPGLILREFSRDVHVRKKGLIRYSPDFAVKVGLDFGHERKTVGTIGQAIRKDYLNVLGIYAGEFRNAPENAKGLAERIFDLTGLEPNQVVLVPDPSAVNEEHGSGIAPLSWYQRVGFTNWEFPLVMGPGSVTQRNRVVRVLLARKMMFFSEECGEDYFEALSAYHLPTDRKTGIVTSNVPVHDMSSHPADSLGYLATSYWTADELPWVSLFAVKANDPPEPASPFATIRRLAPDLGIVIGRRPDSDSPYTDDRRSTAWDAHLRDL